jgi:hypothetical protein
MSSGGKKILIDASLSSVLYYPMSMFLLKKSFIEKVDKHRRRFFWQKNKNKKSYHMVRWTKVYRSKNKGGLGIKNLRRQNISLLVKWWWKLDKSDGLWQSIVKARYLRNKTVASVTSRFSDFPCWKSLLKVKDIYLAGRKISLNNGSIVRFWKDSWGNNQPPLCDGFPGLFEICQLQDCTIKDFAEAELYMPFRRRLHDTLLDQWNEILRRFNDLHLNEEDDDISWNFTKNKIFSTKSVYEFLETNLAGANHQAIWKAKLPLKIQIFMWQMFNNATPTRDILGHRGWPGNPTCSFCDQRETIQHLFFSCPVAKVVWGTLGIILGANTCPNSPWNALCWFYYYLPGGDRMYVIGLAALC